MYHPSLEKAQSFKGRGRRIPVYRDLVADMETPVSAYLKIQNSGPSFLLESVTGGNQVARYSFIGTGPSNLITTQGGPGEDPLQPVEPTVRAKAESIRPSQHGILDQGTKISGGLQ